MSDYKKILERAAHLCSNGEKCQHDVREKMIQWGLGEEDADKAILYLVENNFINDQRYAGYFVRDKLRFNKWGRVKIRYALQQKKIERKIIDECLSKLDSKLYSEILDQLIQNKIKTLGPPNTAQNKSKLLRYAAQKGFTSSEIFEAMDKIKS